MNIIFCGGGTAGHITPAIAIAEAFKKKHQDVNIFFIGREEGKENELVKKAGFELCTIKIEGLSRSLNFKNLNVLKNAYKAKKRAKEIISEISPDLVIGTGGYVSWPVISAANAMGIKTVLHESNATPGLTTKLLLKKCDIFLCGTKNSKYKNSYYVGNPLRQNFKAIPQNEAKKIMGLSPDKKLIVSVGGSIGAFKLNNVCISLMKNYSLKNEKVFHLHSTGHRYFNELQISDPEICKGVFGCKIVPFINDMATALSAADIVISRCGAMTLAEIAFCSAASILIPSPNVTDNHQFKNAAYFEKRNAALLIEEKFLTENLLLDKVNLIMQNDKIREIMRNNAKKLASIDAAEKIANLLEDKLAL